jgi:hypothetical protein
MTVIGAMLAGGDSIDDVDVLRAGAAGELFDQGRTPSTIGTWLRGFIWASVRMLDKVSRQVLARAWAAGLGPDLEADLTVDFDSTICQTYGTAKQGAKFGYTKMRGYHPLLATLVSTGEGAACTDAGRQRRRDPRRRIVRAGDHRSDPSCRRHGAVDVPGRLGVLLPRLCHRLPRSRRRVLGHRGQEQRDPPRYRPDRRRCVGADPVLAR